MPHRSLTSFSTFHCHQQRWMCNDSTNISLIWTLNNIFSHFIHLFSFIFAPFQLSTLHLLYMNLRMNDVTWMRVKWKTKRVLLGKLPSRRESDSKSDSYEIWNQQKISPPHRPAHHFIVDSLQRLLRRVNGFNFN